jgi:hypothetical protein
MIGFKYPLAQLIYGNNPTRHSALLYLKERYGVQALLIHNSKENTIIGCLKPTTAGSSYL